MSSSSSEENDTTIGSRNEKKLGNFYSQVKAGTSRQARHDLSDNELDEENAQFREVDTIDADDAITMELDNLRLESSRNDVPDDLDDNALRNLHQRISIIISREPDSSRKKKMVDALSASNCVREQVFYLRRRPKETPSPSYIHRLTASLDIIVKESFEEEYRKIATILGLVDALAETLILEVRAFGMPQTNEHRSIRKLIANALTNLTYGQIHSKRRLCSYNGFIETVVRIVLESPNVTQVYAGLLRNLSWKADAEMSDALRPTVHALAIAAVAAKTGGDEGCVKATLSALWNLASHSVENKRTICETPNCLTVLATLLSTDARQSAIVESASGILKYVSQYLSNTSCHLELRNVLLSRLISLLGSSSFTIVTNSLGAIANLISKDPHLQNALRHDLNAVQQLNVLRNSNREDIRSAVKNVLNAVNQPTGHTRFGEMSSSMGAPTIHTTNPMLGEPMMHSQHTYNSSTASPRLLPLRATRASPGRFLMQQSTIDQRSCSLPRHFAGGFMTVQQAHAGMMAQSYNHNQAMEHQMYQQQQQQMQFVQQQQQQQQMQNDDLVEIPSETAMGTRSNSARSLGSADPGSVMNTGGWNSTMDTAANSSRALSPVSYSDLPASPTMCAQVFNYGQEQKGSNLSSEQQTPVFTQQVFNHSSMPSFMPPMMASTATTSTHLTNTTQFSGGSTNTMTKGSDNTTVPMDRLMMENQHLNVDVQQLESPDDVLPGPSFGEEDDEGDYAIIGGVHRNTLEDEDLLTRSIQAEKPAEKKVSPRLNGFFSPPQHQQSPKWNGPSKNQLDSDRLLMECIMSEMPQSSSSPIPSKNEEAGRRDAIIASHEPSDQGVRRGLKNENGGSKLARMESLESAASSEDSFGMVNEEDIQNETMGVVRAETPIIDTSIPADCYEEEYDYTDDEHFDEEDFETTQFDDGINPHMTIDCSIISSGSGGSKGELTTTSRDSGALATSTPKCSSSTIPMLRSAAKVSTQTAVANRKTRLPVPRTNGTLLDKNRRAIPQPIVRPRLPPKPKTLESKVYAEQDVANTTTDRNETIYVNAPMIVKEKEHQDSIYMNTTNKQRDEKEQNEDSLSIGGSSVGSTKSAIVQPYNYQKPFITRSNAGMSNEKSVQPNPKQMLVTTV